MNRRTNNGSVATFIVDNKNELTNAPGVFNTITYDSNGNMLSHKGNTTERYALSYDDENRLVQWVSTNTFGNGYLTQFVYPVRNTALQHSVSTEDGVNSRP